MSDNRLAGADFVRAAACTMVVAHHVAQRVSPQVLPPQGAGTASGVMMGAFGVGAFFVLSGYLLARPFWQALDRGEPMPSLATYALRRAARILPGYWLALTVAFVLSFTLLGTTFDGTLLLRYLSGVFMVSDFHWLTWFPVEFNPPLWSIGCEITSYALLPLGLALVFRLPSGGKVWTSRLTWLGVIALVVGAQFLIVRYLQPDSHQRSWDYGLVGGAKVWMPYYNPIGFFAMFATGALAAGLQARVARLRSLWFDLAVVAGLGLAAWSLWSNYPTPDGFGLGSIPYGFPWFTIGVAAVLAAAPSSVLVPRVTELGAIAFVARISFGIYVWHYFFMEVVRVLWQPSYVYWGMRSVSDWALISAGVVVAAVVVAAISYYVMEAPIIRWARGLERRSQTGRGAMAEA